MRNLHCSLNDYKTTYISTHTQALQWWRPLATTRIGRWVMSEDWLRESVLLISFEGLEGGRGWWWGGHDRNLIFLGSKDDLTSGETLNFHNQVTVLHFAAIRLQAVKNTKSDIRIPAEKPPREKHQLFTWDGMIRPCKHCGLCVEHF